MFRYRVAILTLLLAACTRGAGDPSGKASASCDPVLPTPRDAYSAGDAPLPQHFVTSSPGVVVFSDNMPADNPITNAGATLGRVLFYDPRLSANDRVSCASCHVQKFGFSDTARFSPGLHGVRSTRHTMALANARFNAHGRFFWDERAPSLEAQVLAPITDRVEMGMPLDTLERKLSTVQVYRGLFAAAFGSPEVTRVRIAAALAQFVRSLVSTHSRYDAVFATGGAPDPGRLTAAERNGLRLFEQAGCVNCHRSVVQFADQATNNGLDAAPSDTGAGEGRFKPPSLRNVAVRPPYMHDGRFATLRQVVEFYARRVAPSPFLDARLRSGDGRPRRLDLDSSQVAALVAFLEALTDSNFLSAEKFSDPFPCHSRPGVR
jgi:cytochrome c peroxidase